LAMLGAQDLQRSIDELGANSEDTHLHLHLEGRDPDDGMTDIAYEKGANFLLMLEKQVGREKFDLFLKNYFEKHKFQTLTTTQFIDYLNTNLLEPNSVNTNVEEWIYGPGLPSNFEPISSDRFTKVEESLQLAVNGDLPNQSVVSKWTTHEWLHFIRLLPDTLSVSSMQGLDKAFGFADSGNSEIAAAWFEKAIKNGYYENILPQIDNFLVTVGRRKFLTPLYSALIDANDMATAKAIYTKARPNYHAVSVQTMDELIK
jgi:leukotriene-A4 hydrolase